MIDWLRVWGGLATFSLGMTAGAYLQPELRYTLAAAVACICAALFPPPKP